MDVKLLQIGKEVNDGLVMDFFRLIKKELYQSNSIKKSKEGIIKIASIEEIPQSID
jgi:hypothetical protein